MGESGIRLTVGDMPMVIALFSMLGTALLARLRRARNAAQRCVCRNQLKYLGLACIMHGNDHSSSWPRDSATQNIVKGAGKRFAALVKEFKGVEAQSVLTLELVPTSGVPVISGLEVIREGAP